MAVSRESITPGQPASRCARRMWCLPSSSCSASSSSWVGASSSAAASPPAARRMAAASAVCVSPVPGAKYCGVRAQPSGYLETGSVKSSGAAAARQRRWERHLRRKRLALFLFDHGLLLCACLLATTSLRLVTLSSTLSVAVSSASPARPRKVARARLPPSELRRHNCARGVGRRVSAGDSVANVGVSVVCFDPDALAQNLLRQLAELFCCRCIRAEAASILCNEAAIGPGSFVDPLRHERRRGAA